MRKRLFLNNCTASDKDCWQMLLLVRVVCLFTLLVWGGGAWAGVAQVSAGYSHTVIVKCDGTLWAWGYNGYGQLGDGTVVSKNSPVQIGTDSDWRIVSAGYSHTVALKEDGSLWAWGRNDHGQLGDGTTVNKSSPLQVGTDSDWKSIASGYFHTVALKDDGSLWAWGEIITVS